MIVEAVRPHTRLPLDVHLMIEQPERYVQAFAAAGADLISIHAEACVHLHRTLHLIKEEGMKCGVVLNPATPIQTIQHVLADLDYVLLMTVNPGFGGQQFIASMLPKIQELRNLLDGLGLVDIEIEVDGGINEHTARLAVQAGANVLVAGSSVFGQPDRTAAIRRLRG